MKQFVAASEAKLTNIDTPKSELAQQRADKQALRQEEEALRAQRRQQEDAAFKSLKAERRGQQQRRKAKIQKNQRPEWGSKKAADEQWKAIRLGRCSGIELP